MRIERPSVVSKQRMALWLTLMFLALGVVFFRVAYIVTAKGENLQSMAYEQQMRDRLIKAKRGDILDRNGVALATTESVYAVSVVPAQVKDANQTAAYLAEALELDEAEVYDKVTQKVALVRIASKVSKETAEQLQNAALPGVAVDEDIQRVYPYSTLAAQVLGFVGKDNQGILGLEAKYDSVMAGTEGKIMTQTDSRGRKVTDGEERQAPTDGANLVTTLDVVVQEYAEQLLQTAVEQKQAKQGMLIIMNPQNGELYCMVNYPSFDLNDPFAIPSEELEEIWDTLSTEEKNEYWNQTWRNNAISDTYEPGSTFKIITSASGLEEGVVTPESRFYCSGSYIVGDRRIKCWRSPRSHGSESFVEGVQNSCNPVFMEVAERLGAEKFYEYLVKFGFTEKTGVDLAGEATGILYPVDKIGPVELATMGFGQSLTITPLQLLRAASAAVNGGYLVTPHFGKALVDENGEILEEFSYEKGKQVISEETSATMRTILESVVSEGTGSKTYISGFRIGGKTATSEKLPRKSGKYIASFLAFAPAEKPTVMALMLIDEPQGVYYGGTVVGPYMKELMNNILPYLGVERILNEEEKAKEEYTTVPDVTGLTLEEANKKLKEASLQGFVQAEGEVVSSQLPKAGEEVPSGQTVLLDLS